VEDSGRSKQSLHWIADETENEIYYNASLKGYGLEKYELTNTT